jgi:membrane protein
MTRARRAAQAALASLRDLLELGRARHVDQLAAGIAYFAFLALVPLVLLATSVAGFLLDDPDVQARVVALVLAGVPGFEATVVDGGPLDMLITTLVRRRTEVGLTGALGLAWVALRLGASLMAGVEAVFRSRRSSGFVARLRQLAALVVLAVAIALGVLTGTVVAGVLPWLPGPAATVVTFASAALIDALLVLVAFRLLLPAPWRTHLPGALLVAAGWTALKVVGATYVGLRVAAAGAVYGTLGGIVGLLLLLYLVARLFLTGAVVSARTAPDVATDTATDVATDTATDTSTSPDASEDRA